MKNTTAQVKFAPADKEFPVKIVFEDGTTQKLTANLTGELCTDLISAVEMLAGFKLLSAKEFSDHANRE